MSGIDDSGTPPDLPEEYAATYREAYLRALEEEEVASAPPAPGRTTVDELVPLGPATAGRGRPGRPGPLLIGAAAVLLVIGIVVVVAVVSGGDAPSAAPRAGVSAKPSHGAPTRHGKPSRTRSAEVSAPAAPGAWTGDVVPVTPDGVTASCTAAPGVDSAGRKVSYKAANTLDADPSTAWRCDGDATGETLTFTLPEDTPVAEVGLIPGYAKTDPDSGADRYAENNRITRVRWTLADGVTVEQDLDPGVRDRGVQTIRVPRTVTGSITLEVLAVEHGPRNTTAISEVAVRAAG